MRIVFALMLPLTLAACGGAESVWAPDDKVAAQVYHDAGPTSLTLVTVISNRDDAGAHSALIVNASQRVIFDPAGSFVHPNMPERNDVIFGATDPRLESYISYHARVTYRVVVQEIQVSPEVAAKALALVQQNGPVAKANCANATSHILAQLPGFQDIRGTYFPKKLMASFGNRSGVTERLVEENDPDIRGQLIQVAG
jgi:hypothetical protein